MKLQATILSSSLAMSIVSVGCSCGEAEAPAGKSSAGKPPVEQRTATQQMVALPPLERPQGPKGPTQPSADQRLTIPETPEYRVEYETVARAPGFSPNTPAVPPNPSASVEKPSGAGALSQPKRRRMAARSGVGTGVQPSGAASGMATSKSGRASAAQMLGPS
jgi:hypothetical protein